MDMNVVALGLSLLLALVLAPLVIKKLRKMKFGQKILEDGPTWHMNKQYTPTMGGWIFIISTVLTVLYVAFRQGQVNLGNMGLVMCGFALVFGIIGGVDDMTKIKKKQNAGLTPLQKILLQIGAAALFVSVLRINEVISPDLYVPFFATVLSLSWPVYLCFSIFVIVGTVNAVNLTDGIDGLATAVTIVVTGFFILFFSMNGGASPLIFCAALLGGLMAFFLFNRFPARVFMGDTGSLFLGGAVAGMAFAADMPLILVPIGVIYIAETLSDIIQVGYFKATKGKRFFKMAPLHHHFEMCGWSEKKIVAIFTGITFVCCVLTYYYM